MDGASATIDDQQRIANNIMETLKRDCKSSGPDDLNNIATTSMYRASTSQSDNPWKVSTIQSNSAGSTKNPADLASVYSTAQTGHNEVDWKEECYQKIKTLKELYLSDLNHLYQKICKKCQQHDSILNAPQSEQIERLKLFKNMVERTLQFLNVSRNNIVVGVKEKLPAYEKQIIGIINSNRPRQPVSAQQEFQQPSGHPLSMQPQQPQEQHQQQQQQPDNQLNHQMQPTNMPLLSNHNMELSSAQTIQSISNTNMFKLQCLEHQKQYLEQQFREVQMYQQWINQQMQHVLQQQQQILQEQQQQIPQLQQQFQQLAQQSVQLQAANQMSQLQVTSPP